MQCQLCDHGRRKNDAPNHSATLPIGDIYFGSTDLGQQQNAKNISRIIQTSSASFDSFSFIFLRESNKDVHKANRVEVDVKPNFLVYENETISSFTILSAG